jgi:23S rRNA pseudouridine2605 synthase
MSNVERVSYPIRLNRYLSLCGVASRRNADLLIAAGRVAVDGRTAEPGELAPEGAVVTVDGRDVRPTRPTYIVINKPRGVLSAVTDSRRRTVLDLLPEAYQGLGLFPAGRLDLDSEGILVLTNDGKFSQSIIHPSSSVVKTYLVTLREELEEKKVNEWARGVIIDGKLAAPLELSRAAPDDGHVWRVVLAEGLKREIREMARSVGAVVTRLARIGIGRLFLRRLPSGAWREFSYEKLSGMISNGGEI